MPDVEDAMPDDAATREALAELERLDAAEAPEPRLVANPPPPRAYANPANRPLPPPPEDKPFWHDGPSEKAPRVGKISSLEDLCTSQPGLADGQVFLRIDRKEPKMVRGVRTAGFIKDIHGTLTTPEFAEMFGGGKYAITAVRVGDDGNFRSAGQIEVQVQGNPTPDTLPEENDMTSAGRAAAPVYGGEPAQVAVERMRVDERREERFREALRPPDALIEAVGKTNDRAIQMVSDKSNALIEVLRAQTDAAMDAAAKKDDEIRELRFRISELDRQLADAKHHTETEEIKRIREAKDNELRRIAEDHSRTVERISNETRNSIAEEQRRHIDERSRILADNTREFERERAAAQLRENQIRTDYERAEKLMKESFDGRLRDAQDRATVSMAEQKASYERQLDAIKSLEKGRADTAEKFADFKTTTASQELADLRSKNERLEKEVEKLRLDRIKDPVAYLTEVEQSARTLLGMVKASEVETAEAKEEKGFDWKEQLAGMAKQVVERGPDMLRELQGIRAQNQQAQAQASVQQRMALAPAVQANPNVAPPGGPVVAPRRRPPVAPPPAWARAAGPPAPGAAPDGPTPSSVPVYEPTPPPIVATAHVQQVAAVPVVEHHVRVATSPIQDGPQPAIDATTPPPAIEAKQYEEFFTRLNESVNTIPANMFASGFVSSIGKENTAELLKRLTPEHVFQMIEMTGAPSSEIMTLNGQKYVRDVWAHAAQLVAQ